MWIVPYVYVVGIAFMAVFGAQIIAGEWSVDIDVSKYAYWLGYLMLYGAGVAGCMFGLELVRQAFVTHRIRRIKSR
jgi:hypothetical protein